MDYSGLQNGSDIRGVAMEGVAGQSVNLTEQACRDIGRGFAVWLRKRLGTDSLRAAIGRDSRLTGPALARWIGEALAEEPGSLWSSRRCTESSTSPPTLTKS